MIHSQDKPFTCEQCGKKYSRAARLTIHMRTHVGISKNCRLARDLLYVHMKDVINLLQRKETLKHIFVSIQEKNLISAVIKTVIKGLLHKDI